MKRNSTSTAHLVSAAVEDAIGEVQQSFERLCLTAGMEALGAMMEADVTAICGRRHDRSGQRQAYRWGHTQGQIGFHGGKIGMERPRVRDTAIQRCQIHKARNIMDRLPKDLHAPTRRALRQAWEMDDADKAEKLIRNVRRVTRNVKRWRNGSMALRWVAAGMAEAGKGFRKLKGHKHLPALRLALNAHHSAYENPIAHTKKAA